MKLGSYMRISRMACSPMRRSNSGENTVLELSPNSGKPWLQARGMSSAAHSTPTRKNMNVFMHL